MIGLFRRHLSVVYMVDERWPFSPQDCQDGVNALDFAFDERIRPRNPTAVRYIQDLPIA